jgi:hypothetical protein
LKGECYGYKAMINIGKEAVIDSLVSDLNQEGRRVPVRLSELEDFPYSSFSELLAALESEDAKLIRWAPAMESELFSMVASKSEKAMFHSSIAGGYVGVLSGIVLAAIYHWWLFILVPFSYVAGASRGRSTYDKTILSTATCSEKAFCFLYFIKQVSVARPGENQSLLRQCG